MKKVNSKLPLNYVTIKVTQSRIDKGLLAIPTSLIDIFPKDSKKLFLVDENGNVEKKTFTPYSSSSRECRIGGLKMFYDKYNVVNGDELVIQLLDDKKYRILPDKLFQEIVQKNMIEFNHAITDEEVKNQLGKYF